MAGWQVSIVSQLSFIFDLFIPSLILIKMQFEWGFFAIAIHPVVWMTWNSYPNCGQMWMKKLTKTRSIHILKLLIALNDCSLISWHSWIQKMFRSITLCDNWSDTRNPYPNIVGVHWGSPTPLYSPSRNFAFVLYRGPVLLCNYRNSVSKCLWGLGEALLSLLFVFDFSNDNCV